MFTRKKFGNNSPYVRPSGPRALLNSNPEARPMVFICGADHCATLPETLRQKGLGASVHCPDWLLSEIPCPCCV